MNTPDTTTAQLGSLITTLIGAIVAALGGILAATGDLPDEYVVAIVLGVISAATLVAVAWMLSDAIIRRGRAGVQQAREMTAIEHGVGLDPALLEAGPVPADSVDA